MFFDAKKGIKTYENHTYLLNYIKFYKVYLFLFKMVDLKQLHKKVGEPIIKGKIIYTFPKQNSKKYTIHYEVSKKKL